MLITHRSQNLITPLLSFSKRNTRGVVKIYFRDLTGDHAISLLCISYFLKICNIYFTPVIIINWELLNQNTPQFLIDIKKCSQFVLPCILHSYSVFLNWFLWVCNMTFLCSRALNRGHSQTLFSYKSKLQPGAIYCPILSSVFFLSYSIVHEHNIVFWNFIHRIRIHGINREVVSFLGIP